ncbi:hypothetical protein, partial [Streptococcus pneumoniae]|uniref:hypothetical protein n=1 Tax=Streptococcus pneumoniae TaxID=1313 RepID=UPI00195067A1
LSLKVSPITAVLLTFPPACGGQQPHAFSSFIIRLPAQSFAGIVFRNHDAGCRMCGCIRADEQPQAATATVLLSVKFKVPVDNTVRPADGCLDFKTP